MSDGFFPQVKEFFDFGYMLSVYLADSAQFLKKKKNSISSPVSSSCSPMMKLFTTNSIA